MEVDTRAGTPLESPREEQTIGGMVRSAPKQLFMPPGTPGRQPSPRKMDVPPKKMMDLYKEAIARVPGHGNVQAILNAFTEPSNWGKLSRVEDECFDHIDQEQANFIETLEAFNGDFAAKLSMSAYVVAYLEHALEWLENRLRDNGGVREMEIVSSTDRRKQNDLFKEHTMRFGLLNS